MPYRTLLGKIFSHYEDITMPRSGNKEDQIRGTNWSITYWFDTDETPSKARVDEYIELARQKGWVINGQVEKAPTTGNLHYQLHLNTRKQVRLGEVRKTLPTAWIEKARKTVALEQYVKKEDTRVAPLEDKSEKYPTTNKLWELMYREYDIWDKDGWDQADDGEVQFYREEEQKKLEKDPLAFFDKMMSKLIRRGYYVDMLATNPAIRSFFKKFWRDILFRVREEIRQTDRQNELISQSVHIPTIDGADTDDETSAGTPDEAGTDSEGDEEGESDASSGRDESSSAQTDADDDW